ncbi:MAG: Outer rane efflux protein [Verrucomicrobiales bacterium]|nr:Outer rane efflux protein [Verrucomicrobiales bacterium]
MNLKIQTTALLLAIAPLAFAAETNRATPTKIVVKDFAKEPISLADALDIALQQNTSILKAKSDLEATQGIIMQTRAVALPKLGMNGNYTARDPGSLETFPTTRPFPLPDQSWSANIQLTQSIYEGGRVKAALRAAKLTKQQSIANYDTVVADTLLAVRVAYDDTLLAGEQIAVQEASINLLTKELQDTRNRFEAGTVPKFNVLRAEVELANARPRLIRARNAFRISKNNLANLLGYNLAREVLQDVPMQLSGKLEAEPYQIELPVAIGKALERRTELIALRKTEALQRENIINQQGGYKPSVQLVAGYGSRNSSFSDDLTRDVSGWFTGAQATWNIFDGGLTRGRVIEAEARQERAKLDVDDASRRIELEVRTTYSNFIESQEVMESQKKTVEQAEEALRLAEARFGAGTTTQTDVLSAQTALTEARTTQIQALHDYSVTRARLERAIGQIIEVSHGSH